MKKERIFVALLLTVICLMSCSANNTTSVSAQQKEPEKETEIIKEIDSNP